MGLISYVKEEIQVIRERDPAIRSNLEVFLYPSFKAILCYRVAHRLFRGLRSIPVRGLERAFLSTTGTG